MGTWKRLTWSEALVYLLLVQYCTLGTHWINLYSFGGKLSVVGLGLTMTLLFLSVYPILAWKKHSSGVRVGSFRNWLLFGLGAGVLTILVALLSETIVRHFSS